MDSSDLIKKIPGQLDFLLRYVVAGGSAVLALYALLPGDSTFLQVNNSISTTLVLLAILVVGPAIYSVHTAILHPLILAPIIAVLKRKHPIPGKNYEIAHKLSDRVYQAGKREDHELWIEIYTRLTAQIHFLYCSAWGIFLAIGVERLTDLKFNELENLEAASAIGVLLLLAAVVDDYRLTRRQFVFYLEQDKKPGSA